MATGAAFIDPHASTTVTILSGTSLSPVVDCGGATLCGIGLPATWTTAGITFQGSVDGTTFFNVFDRTPVEYLCTAPLANMVILLSPGDLTGFRYLKIRSGTSGSPVNQGADRILTLVMRAV